MESGISDALAKFLADHAYDDPETILLAGREIHGYPPGFVADQLRARQRHRRRLPSMCANSQIVFPPALHLEQCSSEHTARLKADLISEWSEGNHRERLIDLTSGFGVDALAFGTVFKHIECVEPDERLIKINRHNHILLGRTNAGFFPITAEAYLNANQQTADWIYADPSRRRDGQRLIRLSDCEPDVIASMKKLLAIAPDLLIKTSPMLDIKEALRSLKDVVRVVVVSVSNECREVLYHVRRDTLLHEPKFLCCNLAQDGDSIGQPFGFLMSEEKSAAVEFSEPREFLFEPDASVLKAGAFKLAAARFGLYRMDLSTHLFTGDAPVPGFPGRTFGMIRSLTRNETGLQADVMVRNHPLKPSDIVKKFRIREGGDAVVIAFTSRNGRHIMLTRRVEVTR